MPADSFQNMCIFHTLDGLREGLSHFSQPSRCALIYAIGPEDTIRVYDPQNMLREHGPILKELFLDSDEWRKAPSNFEMDKPVSIIQEGVALDAQCVLKPVSWLMTMPPTMPEWLERSGY